ncbi:MAG TPA: NAD(P)(+) transhydrogenase (Re/Si-specific) subunit beta [Gemmatimonadales bacterium]|nr:NAD(P)(+) transhydrogenase (Re/Si-specific) subunit beta [Gemmatimonadales bacterium]
MRPVAWKCAPPSPAGRYRLRRSRKRRSRSGQRRRQISREDKARTVFAIKRSKNPGFAGIDNQLSFSDKTWMLFGDAKAVIAELVKHLGGGSGH